MPKQPDAKPEPANDATLPNWLKEPHRNVLLGFKRQGGTGNIGDVRKYAEKKQGDAIAQAFLKYGLMRGGRGSDFYRLTPEGYEMARIVETVQSRGGA